MRKPTVVPLIVTAALSSCSLASPELDPFFDKAGNLTIRTERVWRWFFVPDRADACLTALRVYDHEKFVWEIQSDQCKESAFPITYGMTPPGFRVIKRPEQLLRGRRYGISACGAYPLETQLDFIIKPKNPLRLAIDRNWETLILSPHDREDRARMAAIDRGEKVPPMEECTRRRLKE